MELCETLVGRWVHRQVSSFMEKITKEEPVGERQAWIVFPTIIPGTLPEIVTLPTIEPRLNLPKALDKIEVEKQ